MVERTEARGFEEFNGEVTAIEKVPSTLKEGQQQYKISIMTIPASITKTGMMYTWIGIPDTATENSVPQGSVIDGFIKAVERLESSLKKAKTVDEVFDWLEGKKFQFSREKLGKAYKGHEAADYWVPIKVLN